MLLLSKELSASVGGLQFYGMAIRISEVQAVASFWPFQGIFHVDPVPPESVFPFVQRTYRDREGEVQMPTAIRGRDGAERCHGRLGGGTLEENEQHLMWGYPQGRESLEGIRG